MLKPIRESAYQDLLGGAVLQIGERKLYLVEVPQTFIVAALDLCLF